MDIRRYPASSRVEAMFRRHQSPVSIRKTSSNRPQRSTHDMLFNYFRPLFLSMTLVGLEFVDVRQEHLNSSRWTLHWNYVILCLVTISLLHNICVQVYLFYKGEANSAFYTLFSIAKLVGSLLVLLIFYLRKLVVCQLMSNIASLFCSSFVSLDSCSPKLRGLRRGVLADTTFCWIFMLLFIFTNVGSNSGDDMKKYFREYFFGYNIESVDGLIPKLILTGETSLYFLATVAPTQFFALYYVLLCRLITILLQSFNNRIRFFVSKKRPASSDFVRHIRLTDGQLTCMVSQVDKELSFLVLLHYMILMADLSKYVYYLIDQLTRRWEDHFEIMFVVIRVSHMVWLFVQISFSASHVSEESVASVVDLQNLLTNMYGSFTSENDHHSHECQQLQVIGLLVKLHTTPSQLTGWKLFVINRGFVLTVCGVVITYSLVLFQITPWAQVKSNVSST